MGSISKSFLSLSCIFLLALLIVGILLPREKTVSVTMEVSCTPSEVFAMVNDLKNWEQWSPWKELDPNMKITYNLNSQGKDAWYSWQGNNRVGYGKLIITDSEFNKEVETILHYEDQAPAKGYFRFTPTEKGTSVNWTMEIAGSKNPLAARLLDGYRYLMMKFFLSKDFGKGLENLNQACQ